ncbi:MAG: hypothetical protein K9J30_02670 [Bacteroidales bacterium]|nr:hypothetical protein [Bacteroidales bacterium]
MNDLVLVEEITCSSAEPVVVNGVTEVKTILGKSCRVLRPSSEASWLAYRLGTDGNLEPGKAYFLEIEYPDDVDRSFIIHNRGGEYNRGLQTGKTLGDSYHPPYVPSNAESISLPHSNQYKKWQTLFWLHDRYAGIELPRNSGNRPEGPADGFLVIVSQFDSYNAPMNNGAAVTAIRLYEAPDFETMKMDIHYPPDHLPHRHLFFREEMADGVVNNDPPALKNPIDWYEHKAQLMHFLGMNTFSKDLLEFGHNQGWDPGSYIELVNTSPSSKDRWGKTIEMLKNYELDVIPYYEYAGTIGPKGLGSEKRARPLGDSLENNNYTHISWTEKANADITDPDTYSDLKKVLERTIVEYKDEVNFVGAWFRPRPSANPVSFSDAALQRFSTETNHEPVSREELRMNSGLYDEYLKWWLGKRKDFLLAMRDYLKEVEVNDDPVILYTTDASESGKTHPDWSQNHNIIVDDVAAWEKLPGDYPVFSLKEIIESQHHLQAQLMPVKSWGNWEWNHSIPPPDPDNYKNTKGVVMTYTFNKAYTVGSKTAFDNFRSESGLAIIRHYCLNENAMKGLGYFVSDIEWHDCYTMLGEARAMANGDPWFIGYLASSAFNRASLPYVRDFNANFLALPALTSELLENATKDEEIVVRKIETEASGTYLAVVNTGLIDKFGVKISLPYKCDVVEAKTGKMIFTGVSKIELDMYPVQLKSLIIFPIS